MQLLKRKSTKPTLPKSWADINIGQYEQILEFKDQEENRYICQSKIIGFLLGVNPKEISAQPLTEMTAQFNQLDWLSQLPELKFINEFNLNGTTMVVNPDISKISSDQFIYLNKIISEGGNKRHSDTVALFVWPKGKSFNSDNYKDIAQDLYDHCSCAVLLPLANFFFLLSEACAPIIKAYLESKIETAVEAMQTEVAIVEQELKQMHG